LKRCATQKPANLCIYFNLHTFRLLKLRELCFGLFEDGDVGIGVFPEAEEILIGDFGFYAIADKGVGASQA
jgi:hypothetical protein